MSEAEQARETIDTSPWWRRLLLSSGPAVLGAAVWWYRGARPELPEHNTYGVAALCACVLALVWVWTRRRVVWIEPARVAIAQGWLVWLREVEEVEREGLKRVWVAAHTSQRYDEAAKRDVSTTTHVLTLIGAEGADGARARLHVKTYFVGWIARLVARRLAARLGVEVHGASSRERAL